MVASIDELAGVTIGYDDNLPIAAWHDEIAAAIADHQVVVIAGETGSGKTTQIPKMCLQLGRRSIAHTQPRRIAARTVAERIASELEVELGDLVGYQVRFTRRASRSTRLKIMTDGVLLAEIGRDRDLRRYDTIIIDEAHERSLNIDFLLGYLKQLLGRRADLKVIVTSATIDTERFAAHFSSADGTPAPVIEVSGRTYPVELRYRPQLVDGEADQIAGVCSAVTELSQLGDGDILVFLSGEREIRDTTEAVLGLQLPRTEVLPLYARLSAADQHRVFAAHPGRRVVLATNVAETSLTVPGIRYVVDAGTARISRYSARTKVQRLPIEPISQASANQRAGRCGRVAPGVCIRLYDEEDFAGRPAFTEPEILRTNLASVILQMTAAELGDIGSFPFVEAPESSLIGDGVRLLHELGALVDERERSRPQLTEIGRRLAELPVDPRMGRMLLAGEHQSCLREMLVIVSGLSIQDPRERPVEHRDAADALHRRFWTGAAEPDAGAAAGPGSDFTAFLRLWHHVREAQERLSGNGFRRLCREEYLHYLRIREWQDLHAQLKQIVRDLGLHRNAEPAPDTAVHTAALAGLLSHIGLLDLREDKPQRGAARPARRPQREYLGARGTRFAVGAGSALAKTPPPLVMAAEIVETNRLWARTVAPITAEQVEEVGDHLLKRSYSEPHWSAKAGSVLAYEQVSLFGVPIVARRPVGYARINPAEAREILLRAALVEGQWRTRHHFYRDNEALRREAEALEERTRRRDLLVDDDTIFAFYDARVPADITSVARFDSWWKKARHVTPDLLTMTLADLTTGLPDRPGDFPETWEVAGHRLAVDYVFEPGDPKDGVTVSVPVSVLNQLDGRAFSWQVPGLRAELATELLRSLPKAIRRQLVPAPDYAARALAWLDQHPAESASGSRSLSDALSDALRALTGELIAADDWNPNAVPEHLRVTFAVTSGESATARVLAEGKDLTALKEQLAPQIGRTLTAAAQGHTRTGRTSWDFGALADQVVLDRGGHRVIAYPGLSDEVDSVGVQVFDTPVRRIEGHRRGLRRLTLLNTPDPTRWVVSHLSNADKFALAAGPYAGVPDLLADARLTSVGELVTRHDAEGVRDQAAFAALVEAVRPDNPELMRGIVALAAEIITRHGSVTADLAGLADDASGTAQDLSEQLSALVFPGFLAATGYAHLVDLPRYLRAAEARLAGARTSPTREQAGLTVVLRCEDAYAELVAEVPPGPLPDVVADVGWLLEELRVSLFAQPIRTRVPVSEKRVLTAVAAARNRIATG